MTLTRIANRLFAHALALPGAWEDHPWGERVAKVGTKVFLFFGAGSARGESLKLAVKLPQSGVTALDRSECEATGYGLGKHGWVTAQYTRGDAPPIDVLEAWIEESYRAIASKKLVRELDARAQGTAAPAAPASKTRETPSRTRVVSAKSSPRRKTAARKKTVARKKPATRPSPRRK